MIENWICRVVNGSPRGVHLGVCYKACHCEPRAGTQGKDVRIGTE